MTRAQSVLRRNWQRIIG